MSGTETTTEPPRVGPPEAHDGAPETTALTQREVYLAYHDALTGLANRALFEDRLKRAIARARRGGVRVAVLLLDLDDFRGVNSRYGFDVGDRVLQHAAQRMSNLLRDSDTLARVGSDELAVIPDGVNEIDGAIAVARKLLEGLRAPMPIGDTDVVVTASIGIAFYPIDAHDEISLTENAERACRRARRLGGDRHALAMRRDR